MKTPLRLTRKRGVTFLEIMVVIVILGILAAVALPNMMGTRSRSALRTGARSIAAAGLQARQAAIAYGKETELIIDMENKTWMILLMPEDDDAPVNRGRRRAPTRSSLRTEREMAPGYTSEEQIRDLPQRVTFGEITTWSDEDNVRPRTTRRGVLSRSSDLRRLTFYPNGSSSGMAIQLVNDRDRSLTVDFDRSSGRPEIYEGEPKTLAQKLRDMGLNPADYGIIDESELASAGRQPGEGFYRIGWSEEERVSHYQSVAGRLMRRAQVRHTEQNEGAAAAYNDARRWGVR